MFQIGPQIGFLLSGREKGTINNRNVDDDLKDVMKGTDFSLVLGVGVTPAENFNFGIRINYGLTDIYTGDDKLNVPGFNYPSIKNRVFHFYIAYPF